jgi:hydrogenase expression/formation protein HypE
MPREPRDIGLSCPLPSTSDDDLVLMAHGGGGRLSRSLLEKLFLPAFDTPAARPRHDSAVLEVAGGRIAFTTDAYVVRPLFFPGGDIGKLAVYGTVNDLAMAGARPVALSAAFVLEEGFPLADLRAIAASMRTACDEVGIAVVTGDTKVVDRGRGDGVYVTTTGIGVVEAGTHIEPRRVCPGDAVIVSGDLGRHGIAVLCRREGLELETSVESDCAPLHGAVGELLAAGVDVHCLRDLTRGGLTSVLNEIALDGGVDIEIEETRVPVGEAVASACELFGLDPFYVANEGRFVAFVPKRETARALDALRAVSISAGAVEVGQVLARGQDRGAVRLRGRYGALRSLDMITGEQLPRIC